MKRSSTVKIYARSGLSPDEGGRISRALARNLAAGKAMTGFIVEALPDDGKEIVILAAGKISARGSRDLRGLLDGVATAFMVGDDRTCMIGQLLNSPKEVRRGSVCSLGPFTVNPDPDGVDG